MAVLAILGLSLAWCACQPVVAPTSQTQVGVSVDEILANPQRFLGHTVVADAQVQRVLSERVIALQAQAPDQELLAILTDQALKGAGAIQSGQTLHLKGTVQPVTREQIRQVERQLGVDLDEDQLLNLAGQAPFIVVQSLSK